MRRGAAAAFAAASALAALAAGPAPARAEIRPRVLSGDLVFISRPDQKPAADTGAQRDAILGAQGAPREIQGLVKEVSSRFDMDPGLIATVVGVESGFDQMAVSPKGARGLMQLMPDTARQYGVRDVHDPRENLEGGVAYLRDLARRYNGDMKLALAAYNAGPEAVERAAGIPNYPETLEYLRRIEARYGQKLTFSGMNPGRTPAFPGGSIRATRDETGALVVTNRRATGMTIVPRRRKGRP